MYIIKWTNGDTYPQSYKKDKHVEREHVEREHVEREHVEREHVEREHAESDHTIHDYSGVSREYVFKDSYKEEVSHRVGEREHIQQCCVNPYLGMNFVKDLAIQEQYLKPKNSNYF